MNSLRKKHEFNMTKLQIPSLIFNSVQFSWNSFASQASFYTQIKFSIKITPIYTGFK